MHRLSALILTTDTLRALGLKHLLESLFDTDTHIAPQAAQSLADEVERCDIIFADGHSCISCLDLLIPKKAKTVLLTSNSADKQHIDSWLHIDASTDSDHIVEQITSILKHIKRNSMERMELSTRETDVLRLVAQGMTNKEIADNLNISINTVLSHRKNISAKLGIKSVSGLCVYAMMNGIIN